MTHHPDPPFPLLVVDTASPTTTIGLGATANDWAWASTHAEAGVALYTCLEEVLKRADTHFGAIRCLAFCEGPGSMLGIRTAAMAIRAWRASGALKGTLLMAYSSLALAAAGIRQSGETSGLTVAVDARRQSWHCLKSDPTVDREHRIHRIPLQQSEELPGPVFLPEGFPVWNPVPPAWLPCPYDPAILENRTIRTRILREVEHPDAYQPEPPVYQKWVPAISRATDSLTVPKGPKS